MTSSTESVRRGRSWAPWGAACVGLVLAAFAARFEALAATPAGCVPACCSIGAGHPASPTSGSLPFAAALTEAESTCDEVDPRESSSHSWPLRCTARAAAAGADEGIGTHRVAGFHASRLAATSLSRLCRRLL